MTGRRTDWAEGDGLDVWSVDRLLDGALSPSEVPDDYASVAALMDLVREGVTPAPSVWGEPAVPEMARIITHRRQARPPARRRRPSALRRVPQTAALAVLLGTLSAGSAAAATGPAGAGPIGRPPRGGGAGGAGAARRQGPDPGAGPSRLARAVRPPGGSRVTADTDRATLAEPKSVSPA